MNPVNASDTRRALYANNINASHANRTNTNKELNETIRTAHSAEMRATAYATSRRLNKAGADLDHYQQIVAMSQDLAKQFSNAANISYYA